MDNVVSWERLTAVHSALQKLLESEVGGMPVTNGVLALSVLLLAFLLRRCFGKLALRQLRFMLRHSKVVDADEITVALTPPLHLLPLLIASSIITQTLVAENGGQDLLKLLNRSFAIFLLTWALFRLTATLMARLDRHVSVFGTGAIDWVDRVAKIVVIILGAATILDVWGIKIGPILTGLGLVGAAVALGAQDLFKNLISGAFIIGEQRFRKDDWIKVDGVVEGTVEVIGLRTTKVRRFDLAPIYVPNSVLANNAVTNFSGMTYRQISWLVGLTYSTDIAGLRKVRDAIEDAIRQNEAFVQPPDAPLFVRIDSFGDSAINLMVYCFTKTTDWGEWLEIKERLACSIKTIVAEAGSDFAFPSQSLYVEGVPKGMESFPMDGAGSDHPASTVRGSVRGQ